MRFRRPSANMLPALPASLEIVSAQKGHMNTTIFDYLHEELVAAQRRLDLLSQLTQILVTDAN